MREKKDRFENAQVDMRTLSLTLTVSIFIALLAFFMVLNSFGSTSATKTKTLQQSLAGSFGFLGGGGALADNDDAGGNGAGDAEQAAAAGLRSVLPDVGFSSTKTADNGRVMVVDVPRDQLTDRWPELKSRVSDVLMSKTAGGKHSIQILALDGPDHAGDLVPLAEELHEEGVDSDLIAVGYQNRGQAAVELRFIIAGGG